MPAQLLAQMDGNRVCHLLCPLTPHHSGPAQVLSCLPVRKGAKFAPAVCVDVRTRLGLPEETVGNLVFWTLPEACDASQRSLGELAVQVRGAISR
jgi:hypothetical protein